MRGLPKPGSVFRWFVQTVYPSIPISFRSGYPMEESVRRLRERVKPHVFAAWRTEAVVGLVRADKVRLQHVIPGLGNSFKPIFVGCFRDDGEGSMLEGRFTTFLFCRILMTFWFGYFIFWILFGALMVGAIIVHAMAGRPLPAVVGGFAACFLFSSVALIVVGCLIFRFGWSRGDISFLSKIIEEALSGPTVLSGQNEPAQS